MMMGILLRCMMRSDPEVSLEALRMHSPLPVFVEECNPKCCDLYMLGVFGGAVKHETATLTNDFQRYDFSSEKWSQVNLMSGNRRTRFAVTTYKNEMWVLGGCVETTDGDSKYESRVLVYRRSKDGWSPRKSMKHSRADFCAAAVGDRLFAIGGEGPQTTSTSEIIIKKAVEELKPNGVWRSRRQMCFARSSFACCVSEDKIYVAGGIGSRNIYPAILECYDVAEDQWTDLTVLPLKFPASLRLAYENNNLYVVVNDLSFVRYDLAERPLNPLRTASEDSSRLQLFDVFTLNGELYVIGRTATNSTNFQKCRPPDYKWTKLPLPLSPWDSDAMGVALLKIRLEKNEY